MEITLKLSGVVKNWIIKRTIVTHIQSVFQALIYRIFKKKKTKSLQMLLIFLTSWALQI